MRFIYELISQGFVKWRVKRSKDSEVREMLRELLAKHRASRKQCPHCWAGKILNPKPGPMMVDCEPCGGEGWTPI